MILLPDHKLAPPPPYPASVASSGYYGTGGGSCKLSTLPPHILLHIVEVTFPSDALQDPALYRRTLYWLTVDLRLACRALHIACMHILRSKYISQYLSLVKPPYTSDPFPLWPAGDGESALEPVPTALPIQSLQRETQVLDMFIALKTREDVFLDESGLHLEREDSFRDLFMLMQPRHRVEDLLREYGLPYGVITLSDDEARSSSKILFSRLSISFSPRKVGLLLTTYIPEQPGRSAGYKRTKILECARERDEKLEFVAKRLVKALGQWIDKKGVQQ